MKKDILPLTCRTQRRDFSTIEPPANILKAKRRYGGEGKSCAQFFEQEKRRSWTSLSRHHSAVTWDEKNKNPMKRCWTFNHRRDDDRRHTTQKHIRILQNSTYNVIAFVVCRFFFLFFYYYFILNFYRHGHELNSLPCGYTDSREMSLNSRWANARHWPQKNQNGLRLLPLKRLTKLHVQQQHQQQQQQHKKWLKR